MTALSSLAFPIIVKPSRWNQSLSVNQEAREKKKTCTLIQGFSIRMSLVTEAP